MMSAAGIPHRARSGARPATTAPDLANMPAHGLPAAVLRWAANVDTVLTFLEYPPVDEAASTLPTGVDVIYPVFVNDPPGVPAWDSRHSGRRMARRYRWRGRPWLALSAAATRHLVGCDVTLSVAATQLDLVARAHAAGLNVQGRPQGTELGPGQSVLRGDEQRLLSRRHDPFWLALLRQTPGLADTSGRRSQAEQGVVCFAAVDWWFHNRAHSDVQLARHLATDRPVLMINSIGLRVPTPGRTTQPLRRITRKLRSVAHGLRTPLAELPNFHVFSPIALPALGHPLLRRFSARAAHWQVRALCVWYGMSQPHLFVTIPSAADIVRDFRRTSLVVNRSDLHSAFPEADGALIAALESDLLRSADAVVYVSHALMDLDAPLVGRRAYFLGHGVDVERFERIPEDRLPSDITAIPRPRIGFFGGIDDYVVDLELLNQLCTAMPDVEFVLIGDATCDMSALERHRNLTWLGMRPYEQIPAYGSAFDVGIMPWLDNDWIQFCNPVKLKEYLALGLPVVTTDFPELGELREHVIVTTRESFAEGIRRALALPTDQAVRQQRRRLVATDTWSVKAEELLRVMREASGRSGR